MTFIIFFFSYPHLAFANPAVGKFSKATLPEAEKLSFTVTFDGAVRFYIGIIGICFLFYNICLFYKEITVAGDLEEGTTGKACPNNKLCFLVTGSMLNSVVFYRLQSCEFYNQTLSFFRAETVDIWGTKGAIKSVTVTGSSNAKAVIPLVLVAPTDGGYTLMSRSYTLGFCTHQKVICPFRDTRARPYSGARRWCCLEKRWCCGTLYSNRALFCCS